MMQTYADWAEAFLLFAKYEAEGWEVSAEHDVIYAGPDPAIVTDIDKKRLSELGWDTEEQYECFYHFA